MTYFNKSQKISKVLLVQPWRDSRSTIFGEMEPYALMVLAGALESSGINVRILDLRIERKKLEQFIDDYRPDMVGVTAITIDYFMALKVLQTVRMKNPSIWTIVGGMHATFKPNDFDENYIDIIVRGPGVEILPILVAKINNKENIGNVNGVLFRNSEGTLTESGNWVNNIHSSISNYLPNRTILRHHGKYRCFGYNYAVLVTSQGCVGRCSFCACWPAMDGKITSKSAENVVEEIKQIIARGHRHIFLGDDNTFGNVRISWETVGLLEKYFSESKHNIVLNGYCRADIITENPELFEAWAKVGLKYLTVGIESISDSELNSFHKNSSTQINEKANRILFDCGIMNLAHIFIRPNFEANDFVNIWKYISKNQMVNPIFPILTGLPGTEIFDEKTSKELYPYFDLAHPVAGTKLPIETFYKQIKWLMYRNYSYKRWLLGKIRLAINFACNKIKLTEPFKIQSCRVPIFISIPFNRYLYRKISNKHGLRAFINTIKSVKAN